MHCSKFVSFYEWPKPRALQLSDAARTCGAAVGGVATDAHRSGDANPPDIQLTQGLLACL